MFTMCTSVAHFSTIESTPNDNERTLKENYMYGLETRNFKSLGKPSTCIFSLKRYWKYFNL